MLPSPDSNSSPGSPSPAPIHVAPPAHRRPRWKWPILGASTITLGAAAWVVWSGQPAASPVSAGDSTARVMRGVLARTLRITGTTTTKKFANLSAPLMTGPDSGRDLVLIHIAEPGSFVKKGQVVAQIDGQPLADHIEEAAAQLLQAQLEYRRLQADQTVATESFRQRVRETKANLEKAKLSARAAEVKNAIDRELLQLAVEEAQLEYVEAERQLELLPERQESERLLSQYRIEDQVRHVGRHRNDLARFTIVAPIDGQLVLKTITRNGQFAQVRVGDQMAPAQPFLRVVDLSNIAVEGAMSQTDADLIRTGQKAKVQFDAYPGLVLDGHVEAVGQLATSGRRTNYFVRRVPVRIALEGTDPRLIPDLTASADVVIDEEDDGLLIPREAVMESGGKQVVYVKQGETILPREVEVGALGSTQAAVMSGLQEGEEIAVQPEPGVK